MEDESLKVLTPELSIGDDLSEVCTEWESHWAKHNQRKAKVNAITRKHREKDLREWVQARDRRLGADLGDRARHREALRQWYQDLVKEAKSRQEFSGVDSQSSAKVPAILLLDPLSLVGYSPEVMKIVEEFCSQGDGRLDLKTFLEIVQADSDGENNLRQLHKAYGSNLESVSADNPQVLGIATALAKYRREQLMQAYNALSVQENLEAYEQGMFKASYRLALAGKSPEKTEKVPKSRSRMTSDLSSEDLQDLITRKDSRFSKNQSYSTIPMASARTPVSLLSSMHSRQVSQTPPKFATRDRASIDTLQSAGTSCSNEPLTALLCAVKESNHGHSPNTNKNRTGISRGRIRTSQMSTARSLGDLHGTDRLKNNAHMYLAEAAEKEKRQAAHEQKWADYDVMYERMKEIKRNLRPMIAPDTCFSKSLPIRDNQSSDVSFLDTRAANQPHCPVLRVLSPSSKSTLVGNLTGNKSNLLTHTPLSKQSFCSKNDKMQSTTNIHKLSSTDTTIAKAFSKSEKSRHTSGGRAPSSLGFTSPESKFGSSNGQRILIQKW